jgi:hypothetical protein
MLPLFGRVAEAWKRFRQVKAVRGNDRLIRPIPSVDEAQILVGSAVNIEHFRELLSRIGRRPICKTRAAVGTWRPARLR